MNYLKKKLKLNHKSKHNEDDDDYDNYVPPVPPHPSTLGQTLQTSAVPLPVSTQSNGDPLQPLPDQTSVEPQISAEELLKQLKEKEFIRRQEEKEKIREQEKEKQNREDWQFFLNLTAKVEDITNKTQSALEKIKEKSTVEEIIQKADSFEEYVPEHQQIIVNKPGQWIAFGEDGHQQNLSQTDSGNYRK